MLILNMSRSLAMRIHFLVVVKVHKLTTAEGGLPKVSIRFPKLLLVSFTLIHLSRNPLPFLIREAELIHCFAPMRLTSILSSLALVASPLATAMLTAPIEGYEVMQSWKCNGLANIKVRHTMSLALLKSVPRHSMMIPRLIKSRKWLLT
jgi:hypothetical protein